MAEKLAIPAGSYPCQWTYRGQVIPGELRLQESRAPSGDIFDAPGTFTSGDGVFRFGPHGDTQEILRAWLRRGSEAVLLDARIQHMLPGTSIVQGQMAVVGWRMPDNLLFEAVRFQVGGLTELAGACPLKSVTVPDTLDNDAVLSATWNAETATQTWVTDSGDSVELDFTATTTVDRGYSFALTSAPVVTVSGKPRSAEDWMRQYARPLAEITTLATQRPQPVSWATLDYSVKLPPGQLPDVGQPRRDSYTMSAQLFAADITQQPYDAAPADNSHLISLGTGSMIRLGPDGAALPDLLAGWQNLQTSYGTFFDYLTTALRANMSAKSRFLALVPALEGFHVARYGDGPMPRRDYSKQRKAVLERIGALEGVDQDDVAFLKDWLSVYASYKLAYRLREIVNKELGDGLRERILARTDPVPEVLSKLVDRPEDVWALMGTARNRIAHGSDNKPSAEQLGSLTRLAHTVAVGAALQLLGVPDAVLCLAIDQDRWIVA
jgi:hypothetical protein